MIDAMVLAAKMSTGQAIGVISAAFAAGLAAGLWVYFKVIRKNQND